MEPKKILGDCTRVARKVLLATVLVLIYLLGFGLTHLFLRLFRRSLLRDAPASEHSYWQPARDYRLDRASARRTS